MSAVAMNCLMVKTRNHPTIGCVVIVNEQGTELLSECVKPTVVIKDYGTPITKITKEDLDKGKSLSVVQSPVYSLIKDHILVGYYLDHDLNALGLSHPECERDLAKFGPYRKNGQPQSLKALAKIYLGKTIQEGVHDSVEDAQTAMELYNLVANNWN